MPNDHRPIADRMQQGFRCTCGLPWLDCSVERIQVLERNVANRVTVSEEVERRHEAIARIVAERDRLRESQKRLMDGWDDWDRQLREMTADRDRLREMLDAANRDYHALSADLATVQASWAACERQVIALEAERDRLKAVVEATRVLRVSAGEFNKHRANCGQQCEVCEELAECVMDAELELDMQLWGDNAGAARQGDDPPPPTASPVSGTISQRSDIA